MICTRIKKTQSGNLNGRGKNAKESDKRWGRGSGHSSESAHAAVTPVTLQMDP